MATEATLEQAAFDHASVEALASALDGGLIRPEGADYDTARRVWNGMIDKHPALIARCRTTDDVIRALDFARENRIEVAVRGGGHNAAGLSTCDGGIVVDLSPMQTIEVDPAARTVRAGGGVRWADLDRATQEHGLATTGGVVSTTGIAGLTLGGGLGWLMRSYGLACDNLLSAEVVTADGRVVTASADEHADLFWGLRGGGGNFGVVTSFEFRLHPVTDIQAGMLIHPMERARDVLRFYREATRAAPDELTIFAALLTSPDGIPVAALAPAYNGPFATGEAALRPLRDFGPPLADQVGPMPYVQLQSMMDEAFPAGLNVYWRSDFLTDLSDAVIDVILEYVAKVPSPMSAVFLEHFGGAVARVGQDETAYSHRDAEYDVIIVARWMDPAEADVNVAWARAMWQAMRPYARGVYVNYLGVGDAVDRVRDAYGDDKYARLVELKTTYDPTNLFRRNHNIPPAP